jgi:hypothetical protein
MDKVLVGSGYESHLTDTDLILLASVTGGVAGAAAARRAPQPGAWQPGV